MNLTETILTAAANREILTYTHHGDEASLTSELSRHYTDPTAARKMLSVRFTD